MFKGTVANEAYPAFSPDGRWIAYVSAESGANEVYVSPFPGPGATVPISNDGGTNRRWSAVSRELMFWGKLKIMSASYTATDTFAPDKPRLWAPQDSPARADFDVHPDGKRVAVGLVDPDAFEAARFARDKIVFWSGFVDYLDKNVAVKK